ncbi:hypothetical protein M404DRAFT_1000304, partial [Pisolithus tinctorius Marx 270]
MADGREPADVHQKQEPRHFDHPVQSYTQMAARKRMKNVSPGRVKRGEETAKKARGTAEKRVRYDLKSSK